MPWAVQKARLRVSGNMSVREIVKNAWQEKFCWRHTSWQSREVIASIRQSQQYTDYCNSFSSRNRRSSSSRSATGKWNGTPAGKYPWLAADQREYDDSAASWSRRESTHDERLDGCCCCHRPHQLHPHHLPLHRWNCRPHCPLLYSSLTTVKPTRLEIFIRRLSIMEKKTG